MQAGRRTDVSMQRRIVDAQVALLYSQLPIGLLVNLIVGIVLIVAVWNHIPAVIIAGWAVAMLIVSAARLALYMVFNSVQPESRDIWCWRRYFLVGSAASGTVWGAAGVLLMPAGAIEQQMLVIFILSGMMAGASQSLSAVLTAYAAFCIPAALPVSIWLLTHPSRLHSFTAALFLFFAFALLLLGRYSNRALAESFRLRFENVDLIASLRREVATRRKTEDRLHGHRAMLETLATGQPLETVLNQINRMVEHECPEAKSSVLLLDNTGRHLLCASAPSLPQAYSDAIHGGAIGPKAGSCGTAAFRDEMVIVEDIASDPLWADYKDLALAHGLRACWSVPIHDSRGAVLGTFALYYAEPRRPDADEIELIQTTARLAGIAIERYRTMEKLDQMAHFDVLTGLPNRALFMDRLQQAIRQAQRWRQSFALLFIDLDNFKTVNDTLGHEAGDRALSEVAHRLLSCVRGIDTVARLGGDEFTIILMDVHGKRNTSRVVRKILAALCVPIHMEEKDFEIGGSIGISLYPADGNDADTLLRKADTAMYQAKKNGGNVSVFYTDIKPPKPKRQRQKSA